MKLSYRTLYDIVQRLYHETETRFDDDRAEDMYEVPQELYSRVQAAHYSMPLEPRSGESYQEKVNELALDVARGHFPPETMREKALLDTAKELFDPVREDEREQWREIFQAEVPPHGENA